MGSAIDSLGPAVAISRENPAFLAASLLTLVGSGTASLVVGRIPVAGELLNSVLVTPAFAALMLGMAAAGLATDAASIGDGVESLRANYRSLVGAYVLLVAGVVAVLLAWAIEVAVVVLLDTGTGVDLPGALAATDPAALGTSGPVVAVTLLALALALFGGLAVQFFDVAIVVDGESAVSSFGTSWGLFRDAPASVLGYSVIRLFPVVAAGILVAVAYRVGASALGPTGGTLAALAVAAVVGPVTFAFITAYHVAYYDRRVGRPVRGRGSDGATPVTEPGRSSRS